MMTVLKHILEDVKAVSNLSYSQLRIMNQDMNKFALQIANCLLSEHEISDLQAASYFLKLLDYYTLHSKTEIQYLNLV